MNVGTVGFIINGKQANDYLEDGKADIVFLGRESMRYPPPLRPKDCSGTRNPSRLCTTTSTRLDSFVERYAPEFLIRLQRVTLSNLHDQTLNQLVVPLDVSSDPVAKGCA